MGIPFTKFGIITTISMALGETIRAEEVQHLGLMYFNDDTVEFFIFFIGK